MCMCICAWGGERRRNGHGYPSLSRSLPTIPFVDSCGGPGGGGGAFQITVPELFWAAVNREQGPWSPSVPTWGTKVVSGALRTARTVYLGGGWRNACVRACVRACVIWGS